MGERVGGTRGLLWVIKAVVSAIDHVPHIYFHDILRRYYDSDSEYEFKTYTKDIVLS